MINKAYDHLIKIITEDAQPLLGDAHQYDALINDIGDARIVLMGEATHGTSEFYQARSDLSKRLIKEKGFMAVAIEGDWPDACALHRYVQGEGNKRDYHTVLSAFKRFPTWMWRNKPVSHFIEWLRDYNDPLSPKRKIGFYGLDLYSFYDSMQAVIDYLSTVDPEAAKRAEERYACFDHLKVDPQHYGFLCAEGLREQCSKEVLLQMIDLQYHANVYLKKDGLPGEDAFFQAFQNARLVKNAEHYYRSMFEGHTVSWNNRDTHMAETLTSVMDHLELRSHKPAKVIVWAHNSHVGDARATEMGEGGELNIGQLVRELHPEDTYVIGFSTYQGTVMAASHWGGPGKTQDIIPGIEGSYEALFHDLPYANFLLLLRNNPQLEHFLKVPRLQRAIGVIYARETERASHYFFTKLPYQVDALIHFDKTSAVQAIAK